MPLVHTAPPALVTSTLPTAAPFLYAVITLPTISARIPGRPGREEACDRE
jgi:hypothetical protein